MALAEQILIIGAGPAGLMAAIAAARAGAPVLVLEKMPAPARKLLLTGNGRCNLTNTAPRDAALTRFNPEAARFLRPAFAALTPEALCNFFARLGIQTCVEDNGRVFPVAGGARAVRDALVAEAARLGATIRTGAPAREIRAQDNRVAAVVLRSGEEIPCASAILAAGGASYPATGSDGAGARIAAALGHAVRPLHAALVPLVSDDPLPPALQGLALHGVRVALWADARRIAAAEGDVLFTHFGISGPALLALSGAAVEALDAALPAEIALDLRPHLDDGALDRELVRLFAAAPRRALRGVLAEFAPQRFIEAIIARAGIPPDQAAGATASPQRKRLRILLKDLRLRLTAHLGLGVAMVTAGGVALDEVAPRTLASRRVAGLYFAGEVLDIAGDTGGFNLHAAFATGTLAGRSAATGNPKK